MRPFGFVFFFGMSLSSCAVDEVRWPSSTQSLDTYLDSQRWDCWDTLTSYACTDYVCDVCIRHTCMTVRLYLKNMCYAAMHIVLLFIYIHIGYRLGDYFCIVYLFSYTHNYLLKTMYVWSFFTYIHIHIYAYVYIIYLYIYIHVATWQTCIHLAGNPETCANIFSEHGMTYHGLVALLSCSTDSTGPRFVLTNQMRRRREKVLRQPMDRGFNEVFGESLIKPTWGLQVLALDLKHICVYSWKGTWPTFWMATILVPMWCPVAKDLCIVPGAQVIPSQWDVPISDAVVPQAITAYLCHSDKLFVVFLGAEWVGFAGFPHVSIMSLLDYLFMILNTVEHIWTFMVFHTCMRYCTWCAAFLFVYFFFSLLTTVNTSDPYVFYRIHCQDGRQGFHQVGKVASCVAPQCDQKLWRQNT